MNRWWRLLQHRWFDETDARRALGGAALQRVTEAIAASEAYHRGEIRVVVEAGLPLSYLWREATPRERAVSLFGKLRVWDTEENNGVLIYLLLAEHAIEIVADRGLARRVPAQQWSGIVERMRTSFRAGRFDSGLLEAVATVDALLREHFPRQAGRTDVNELPDPPVLL
jgi:uncharacterized membrane protein